MKKKVLIITYHFPPRPSVASIRLGGLAKFLPEFDWEPTVLTAKFPSTSDPRYHVVETKDSDILIEWKRRLGFSPDKTFRDQLGQTGKKDTVMDLLLNGVKEILAYPDYNKKWYRYAVPVARDLLKTERFDAIISSAGPYTAHLIAHTLKKESGIPWIADFRDLWTQNHYYSYGRVRKHFETKLELRTLANADVITATSHPFAEKLRRLHRVPVYVVPNGFDPDLLNHTTPATPKFSINYTGRLYRGKTDPEPIFKAMRNLINEQKMDPSNVEIHFWGCAENWLQDMINDYNLSTVIFMHDTVPREQALEIQRSSQLLLLLIWNDPKEEVVVAKVFEYLAARRPVLAIGPSSGAMTDLIDETKAGFVAESEEEIEEILTTVYRQFKAEGKVRYYGIENKIRQYTHEEMAQKIAGLLNQLKSG